MASTFKHKNNKQKDQSERNRIAGGLVLQNVPYYDNMKQKEKWEEHPEMKWEDDEQQKANFLTADQVKNQLQNGINNKLGQKQGIFEDNSMSKRTSYQDVDGQLNNIVQYSRQTTNQLPRTNSHLSNNFDAGDDILDRTKQQSRRTSNLQSQNSFRNKNSYNDDNSVKVDHRTQQNMDGWLEQQMGILGNNQKIINPNQEELKSDNLKRGNIRSLEEGLGIEKPSKDIIDNLMDQWIQQQVKENKKLGIVLNLNDKDSLNDMINQWVKKQSQIPNSQKNPKNLQIENILNEWVNSKNNNQQSHNSNNYGKENNQLPTDIIDNWIVKQQKKKNKMRPPVGRNNNNLQNIDTKNDILDQWKQNLPKRQKNQNPYNNQNQLEDKQQEFDYNKDIIDVWYDSQVINQQLKPQLQDNNLPIVKQKYNNDYRKIIDQDYQLKDDDLLEVMDEWVQEVSSYNGIKRERNKNIINKPVIQIQQKSKGDFEDQIKDELDNWFQKKIDGQLIDKDLHTVDQKTMENFTQLWIKENESNLTHQSLKEDDKKEFIDNWLFELQTGTRQENKLNAEKRQQQGKKPAYFQKPPTQEQAQENIRDMLDDWFQEQAQKGIVMPRLDRNKPEILKKMSREWFTDQYQQNLLQRQPLNDTEVEDVINDWLIQVQNNTRVPKKQQNRQKNQKYQSDTQEMLDDYLQSKILLNPGLKSKQFSEKDLLGISQEWKKNIRRNKKNPASRDFKYEEDINNWISSNKDQIFIPKFLKKNNQDQNTSQTLNVPIDNFDEQIKDSLDNWFSQQARLGNINPLTKNNSEETIKQQTQNWLDDYLVNNNNQNKLQIQGIIDDWIWEIQMEIRNPKDLNQQSLLYQSVQKKKRKKLQDPRKKKQADSNIQSSTSIQGPGYVGVPKNRGTHELLDIYFDEKANKGMIDPDLKNNDMDLLKQLADDWLVNYFNSKQSQKLEQDKEQIQEEIDDWLKNLKNREYIQKNRWGNPKGSVKDSLDEFFDNKIRLNIIKPILKNNSDEDMEDLLDEWLVDYKNSKKPKKINEQEVKQQMDEWMDDIKSGKREEYAKQQDQKIGDNLNKHFFYLIKEKQIDPKQINQNEIFEEADQWLINYRKQQKPRKIDEKDVKEQLDQWMNDLDENLLFKDNVNKFEKQYYNPNQKFHPSLEDQDSEKMKDNLDLFFQEKIRQGLINPDMKQNDPQNIKDLAKQWQIEQLQKQKVTKLSEDDIKNIVDEYISDIKSSKRNQKKNISYLKNSYSKKLLDQELQDQIAQDDFSDYLDLKIKEKQLNPDFNKNRKEQLENNKNSWFPVYQEKKKDDLKTTKKENLQIIAQKEINDHQTGYKQYQPILLKDNKNKDTIKPDVQEILKIKDELDQFLDIKIKQKQLESTILSNNDKNTLKDFIEEWEIDYKNSNRKNPNKIQNQEMIDLQEEYLKDLSNGDRIQNKNIPYQDNKFQHMLNKQEKNEQDIKDLIDDYFDIMYKKKIISGDINQLNQDKIQELCQNWKQIYQNQPKIPQKEQQLDENIQQYEKEIIEKYRNPFERNKKVIENQYLFLLNDDLEQEKECAKDLIDEFLDIKIKQDQIKPELKDNSERILKEKINEWQNNVEQDKKYMEVFKNNNEPNYPSIIISQAADNWIDDIENKKRDIMQTKDNQQDQDSNSEGGFIFDDEQNDFNENAIKPLISSEDKLKNKIKKLLNKHFQDQIDQEKCLPKLPDNGQNKLRNLAHDWWHNYNQQNPDFCKPSIAQQVIEDWIKDIMDGKDVLNDSNIKDSDDEESDYNSILNTDDEDDNYDNDDLTDFYCDISQYTTYKPHPKLKDSKKNISDNYYEDKLLDSRELAQKLLYDQIQDYFEIQKVQKKVKPDLKEEDTFELKKMIQKAIKENDKFDLSNLDPKQIQKTIDDFIEDIENDQISKKICDQKISENQFLNDLNQDEKDKEKVKKMIDDYLQLLVDKREISADYQQLSRQKLDDIIQDWIEKIHLEKKDQDEDEEDYYPLQDIKDPIINQAKLEYIDEITNNLRVEPDNNEIFKKIYQGFRSTKDQEDDVLNEQEINKATIRDLLDDWFEVAILKQRILPILKENDRQKLQEEANLWQEDYQQASKFGKFTPLELTDGIKQYLDDVYEGDKDNLKLQQYKPNHNIYAKSLTQKEKQKQLIEDLLDDYFDIMVQKRQIKPILPDNKKQKLMQLGNECIELYQKDINIDPTQRVLNDEEIYQIQEDFIDNILKGHKNKLKRRKRLNRQKIKRKKQNRKRIKKQQEFDLIKKKQQIKQQIQIYIDLKVKEQKLQPNLEENEENDIRENINDWYQEYLIQENKPLPYEDIQLIIDDIIKSIYAKKQNDLGMLGINEEDSEDDDQSNSLLYNQSSKNLLRKTNTISNFQDDDDMYNEENDKSFNNYNEEEEDFDDKDMDEDDELQKNELQSALTKSQIQSFPLQESDKSQNLLLNKSQDDLNSLFQSQNSSRNRDQFQDFQDIEGNINQNIHTESEMISQNQSSGEFDSESEFLQFTIYFNSLYDKFNDVNLMIGPKQYLMQRKTEKIGFIEIPKNNYPKRDFKYHYIGTTTFKNYKTENYIFPNNQNYVYDCPKGFGAYNCGICCCQSKLLATQDKKSREHELVRQVFNHTNVNNGQKQGFNELYKMKKQFKNRNMMDKFPRDGLKYLQDEKNKKNKKKEKKIENFNDLLEDASQEKLDDNGKKSYNQNKLAQVFELAAEYPEQISPNDQEQLKLLADNFKSYKSVINFKLKDLHQDNFPNVRNKIYDSLKKTDTQPLVILNYMDKNQVFAFMDEDEIKQVYDILLPKMVKLDDFKKILHFLKKFPLIPNHDHFPLIKDCFDSFEDFKYFNWFTDKNPEIFKHTKDVDILQNFKQFKDDILESADKDFILKLDILTQADEVLISDFKNIDKTKRKNMAMENLQQLKIAYQQHYMQEHTPEAICISEENSKHDKKKDQYFQILEKNLKQIAKIQTKQHIEKLAEQIENDKFKNNDRMRFVLNVLTQKMSEKKDHRDFENLYKDQMFYQIINKFKDYTGLKKTQFYQDVQEIVIDFNQKIQSDTLDLEFLNDVLIKYQKEISQLLGLFNIKGIEEKTQNLTDIFEKFIEYKKKVDIWLKFHGDLKSIGIPSRIKMLLQQEPQQIIAYEINELFDILSEYEESIDIINLLHDSPIFRQIVENCRLDIQGKMFNEIEDSIQSLLMTQLVNIQFRLCSYFNPTFQFKINDDDEDEQEGGKLELVLNKRINQNIQNMEFESRALDYQTLEQYFSINQEYFVDLINLQTNLDQIQNFFTGYCQYQNAIYHKQLPSDIMIFLDMDKQFKKCKCIKKTARLFKYNDENIKKYVDYIKEFKIQHNKLNLEDIIKNNKKTMKKLQQICSDFKDQEFQEFLDFIQIKKAVKFLVNYKNQNFQDMIGTYEEINPQLEQALKHLHKNNPNTNSLFEFVSQKNDFKELFQTLLEQIKQEKQKNPQYIKELKQTIPYLQIIEDMIQGPNSKADSCLFLIKRIQEEGKYFVEIQQEKQDHWNIIDRKILKDELNQLYQKIILLSTIKVQEQYNMTPQQMNNILSKFSHQLFKIRELGDLVEELYLLGHPDYYSYKGKFDNNSNGYEGCMELLLQEIEKCKIDLQNWQISQKQVFKKYPYLTLIPQKMYKVINDYYFYDSKNQEQLLNRNLLYQLKDLFLGIDSSINYKKLQYQPNKNSQNLSNIEKIGEFINANFKDKVQLIQDQKQEKPVKIYINKFLKSEKKEFMNELIYSVDQISNKTRSYHYYFCNSETSFQDIELFVYRFCYLNQNRNFYISNLEKCANNVRNQVLNFLKQMEINQEKSTNSLIILYFVRDNDDWIGVQFPQYQNNQKNINILKKFIQNTETYVSQYAGLGKSYQIEEKMKNLKKTCRIPIHLQTYSKKELIQLFQQKLQPFSNKYQGVHLDITDTDNKLELDILLFEILVLRYLNCNNSKFININNKSQFFIEIQNTYQEELTKSLVIPTIFKTYQLSFHILNINIDQNVNKPIQRCLRYLSGLQKGKTSEKDKLNLDFGFEYMNGNKKWTPISEGEGQQLLKDFLFSDLKNPSYYVLMFFVKFFANQMKGMDNSPFFSLSINSIDDKVKLGLLRYSLINLLYEVAKTQAIQSSSMDVDIYQLQKEQQQLNAMEKVQNFISEVADQVPKFSDLESDFVAFQKDGTITSCYSKSKLPKEIYKMYVIQKENKQEVEIPDLKTDNQCSLTKWLIYLCNKKASQVFKVFNATTLEQSLMPHSLQKKLKEIAIYSDNFYKMALIYLRIQSKMPAIPMGETGIGKTALIDLLSALMGYQYIKLDVHAGVQKQDIISKVEQAQKRATKDHKLLLFFDEINTNDNINGILKELIVDKKLLGEPLSKYVVPIGACNPYKLKSSVKQGIAAGLEHIQHKQNIQPLVYQVKPMPQSMFYFIWNYDQLNTTDEIFYIKKIISCEHLFLSQEINHFMVESVFLSQQFVRECNMQMSCSLRDVKRFSKLATWFMEKYYTIKQEFLGKNKLNLQEIKFKSIILALAFCYHNRLPNKELKQIYRDYIIKLYRGNMDKHQLRIPIQQINQKDLFNNVLKVECLFLLKCVNPSSDIAKNLALRENIFAMLVCILNKIPLFLTGPPGSSKSLAFSLIQKSMRGLDSNNSFFRKLPCLKIYFYQGNLQSTSSSIEKIYKQTLQRQNYFLEHQMDHIAVMFFDEIGLSELSQHNPLKILHSILEQPEISFISISNWQLDASKMNRGIHVSREIPSQEDLEYTSVEIIKGILNTSESSSELYNHIEKVIIIFRDCMKQLENYKKNLFGLRDFYALIKNIAIQWNPDATTFQKVSVIFQSFYRNLGGFTQSQEILKSQLQKHYTTYYLQIKPLTSHELIAQNLQESITPNPNMPRSRNLYVFTDDPESAVTYCENQLQQKCKVFIGSDFKEDSMNDNLIQKTINNIITCIETGIPVIVVNLDQIYQYFYDMLNQNPIQENNGRYLCRISYGFDSNMVEVHPQFKFIIVAKTDIELFDMALLNRFEKHEYNRINQLNQMDSPLLKQLKSWLQKYFKDKKECFVFDDEDEFSLNSVLSSIIQSRIEISKKIHQNIDNMKILIGCKEDIIQLTHLTGIIKTRQAHDIQMVYFQKQMHENLQQLVQYYNNQSQDIKQQIIEQQDLFCDEKGYSLIVYTFSKFDDKIIDSLKQLDCNSYHVNLEGIVSESQLDEELIHFFTDIEKQVLFITADILNDSYDRLMLTRSYVNQQLYMYKNPEQTKKTQQFKRSSTIYVNNQIRKSVIFIVRMMDRKGQLLSFSPYWKQISLDNLDTCYQPPEKIYDIKDKESETYPENVEKILEIRNFLQVSNLINIEFQEIITNKQLVNFFLQQQLIQTYAFIFVQKFDINQLQTFQQIFQIENQNEEKKQFLQKIETALLKYYLPQNPYIADKEDWINNINNSIYEEQSMSYYKALINFIEEQYIIAISNLFQDLNINNEEQKIGLQELWNQNLDKMLVNNRYSVTDTYSHNILQNYNFWSDYTKLIKKIQQINLDNEKIKYIILRLHNFENKFQIYQDIKTIIKITLQDMQVFNSQKIIQNTLIVDQLKKYKLLRSNDLESIFKDITFQNLKHLVNELENELVEKLVEQCDENFKDELQQQDKDLLQYQLNEIGIDKEYFTEILGRFISRFLLKNKVFQKNKLIDKEENLIQIITHDKFKDLWNQDSQQQIYQLSGQSGKINIKLGQIYETYWNFQLDNEEDFDI